MELKATIFYHSAPIFVRVDSIKTLIRKLLPAKYEKDIGEVLVVRDNAAASITMRTRRVAKLVRLLARWYLVR